MVVDKLVFQQGKEPKWLQIEHTRIIEAAYTLELRTMQNCGTSTALRRAPKPRHALAAEVGLARQTLASLRQSPCHADKRATGMDKVMAGVINRNTVIVEEETMHNGRAMVEVSLTASGEHCHPLPTSALGTSSR